MKVVKKIFIILGWICLIGGIGFTIFYAYTEREAVKCKEIVVNINPKSPRFLDEPEIVDMIEKSGEMIIGSRLTAININKLQMKLNASSSLANVQIFKKVESNGLSFTGKLIVNLDERTPILRVKNETEDYYMDMQGNHIPTSSKYVERILIASGTIPTNPEVQTGLLKMADFVNHDDFWRAQIEQVSVKPNGELLMLPQVGDYVIEFGMPDDYVLKFRNLKAVYQQGFKHFGWNKYSLISVKYRNQVVCTKK
jgi:cell division protein FtsQ